MNLCLFSRSWESWKHARGQRSCQMTSGYQRLKPAIPSGVLLHSASNYYAYVRKMSQPSLRGVRAFRTVRTDTLCIALRYLPFMREPTALRRYTVSIFPQALSYV